MVYHPVNTENVSNAPCSYYLPFDTDLSLRSVIITLNSTPDPTYPLTPMRYLPVKGDIVNYERDARPEGSDFGLYACYIIHPLYSIAGVVPMRYAICI